MVWCYVKYLDAHGRLLVPTRPVCQTLDCRHLLDLEKTLEKVNFSKLRENRPESGYLRTGMVKNYTRPLTGKK